MGRLVYQNTAAFAAPGGAPRGLTVVGIGTPPGVDDPLAAADLAQLPGGHDFLDLLVQLVGALVEHDAEGRFGMGLMAVDHLLHVLGADTGRLFADDVHAVLHGVDGHLMVQVVGNSSDDGVTVAGGDHVLVVLVNGDVGIFGLGSLPLGGIVVADGAQGAVGRDLGGGHAGESGGSGEDVAVRAALCAEADDTVTNFVVHVAFSLLNVRC